MLHDSLSYLIFKNKEKIKAFRDEINASCQTIKNNLKWK
jgi:hypothetical protein